MIILIPVISSLLFVVTLLIFRLRQRSKKGVTQQWRAFTVVFVVALISVNIATLVAYLLEV